MLPPLLRRSLHGTQGLADGRKNTADKEPDGAHRRRVHRRLRRQGGRFSRCAKRRGVGCHHENGVRHGEDETRRIVCIVFQAAPVRSETECRAVRRRLRLQPVAARSGNESKQHVNRASMSFAVLAPRFLRGSSAEPIFGFMSYCAKRRADVSPENLRAATAAAAADASPAPSPALAAFDLAASPSAPLSATQDGGVDKGSASASPACSCAACSAAASGLRAVAAAAAQAHAALLAWDPAAASRSLVALQVLRDAPPGDDSSAYNCGARVSRGLPPPAPAVRGLGRVSAVARGTPLAAPPAPRPAHAGSV